MRRVALFCLTALVAACQSEQPATPTVAPIATLPATDSAPPVAPGLQAEHRFDAAITSADLAQHIKTLASDEFEGRAPGSLGERMTTTYLKSEFERLGLRPANNGSFFQSVPMLETLADSNVSLAVKTAKGEQSFAFGSEMVVGSRLGQPEIVLDDSAVVFVGYGVNAPEYAWNDYAGIDVKGKTVIVLVNDPGYRADDAAQFKGATMTYYGRWTYKYEEAARQGAAACFIVHDTDGAAYGWEVVKNGANGAQFDLPASEDSDPRLQIEGWISTESAERLFAASGQDYQALRDSADRSGFKAVDLKASADLTLRSTVRSKASENVLAILPGSQRPNEVIVYTAHWDHLGKHAEESGDNIYNGAIDNASGVAALLEIAEAFVHQETPPERSVLFLAVTLEESGLLGSRYYAAHPVYPLATTVANINMDAFYDQGRTRDIAVFGFGQSELDQYLSEAAATQGRFVVQEPTPQKGYYYRSDHFNFARQGVPALYAKAATDKIDGGRAAGSTHVQGYLDQRYHKPSDEYTSAMDLSGVLEDAAALYAVGRKLAQETRFPEWSKDSEFRAVREKSRASESNAKAE